MLQGIGITKSYMVKGKPKLVLDGLDFEVPAGVSLGLLGATGRASRRCCRSCRVR